MESNLPKRPKHHIIRNQAIAAVRRSLPAEWIVRDQDGDNDYGVELEIELAGDVASGQTFKVQVKGHERVNWARDDTYLQPVREASG